MTDALPILQAFNRGLVSPLALSRMDIKRVPMSAEIQDNWIPRVLGSMSLRPGLGYIDSTYLNKRAFHLPFVFSNSDTAIVELTDQNMRIRVSEAVITRGTVATAVANGNFTTDLSSWTNADQSGATSSWASAGGAGALQQIGNGFSSAILTQQVTVASGDQNKEHALRIIVLRGQVRLRVGTSSGDDSYVHETTLAAGTHSLAFTPTGNFFIYFANSNQSVALVDSVNVEAAGAMLIPTPYLEGDMPYLRHDESADVIYLACAGYEPMKIERRGLHSWSLVFYRPPDGPFGLPNITPVTIAASALVGEITLAASDNVFRAGHVGALYSLTSAGQNTSNTLGGSNQFTDPIRVTGVGAAQRTFAFAFTGTWTGTLTLQQSVGSPGSWTDVTTYTGNTSTTYADGLDNQIIYYRFGFKAAAWLTGTVTITQTYTKSGGITGIVKITAVTGPTAANATVLKPLGSTDPTPTWTEGSWSSYRGWPTCCKIFEGRLWWAGKGNIYGSISDAYESFSLDQEGDAGPIVRTIGTGPVDNISWFLPLQRLLMGTDGREFEVISSSIDDPITPSNFGLRSPSTQGSGLVEAIQIDTKGLFVQKSGNKLFQMELNKASLLYDYTSTDLTDIVPEIGKPGIIKLASQRQLDTRVHCVRKDGVVALLISQEAEDVLCWVTVSTPGGIIEDVVIMPGLEEDQVYYVVNRTVNGSTVRYFEKWAMESECIGGTFTKLADSFITFNNGGSPSATLSVPHLKGATVVVWADGKDNGTYVVNASTGNVTLPAAVTAGVVGLYYEAKYKSTKLAYGVDGGTAINATKRVDHIGLVMNNTHARGLRYGSDFETDPITGQYIHMDPLPESEGGLIIDPDYIWPEYDFNPSEFNGTFDTDSRLCLLAAAPRPCTLLSVTLGMETHAKT